MCGSQKQRATNKSRKEWLKGYADMKISAIPS